MIEIKLSNGETARLVEDANTKVLQSKNYNFIFNKSNGFFVRWGETKEDDGDLSVGLPEIADIEISTVCNGVHGICKFCYKENTPRGENMSLETFQTVLEKLPPTVTQVALGIGNIDGNPDLWNIMKYCHSKGVIPNITINGSRMNDELFDRLASTVGACAVSKYDKDTTYNAVKELTDRGLKQTNIHFMLSEETFDDAMQTLDDIKTDNRLQKLNAIVFLSLKTKGCAKTGFLQLSQDKFKALVDRAIDNNIPIGFDSCGSFKFLKSIEGRKNYKMMEAMVEPCEATIYSSYINVKGDYFPCSFATNTTNWEKGISVIDCDDFLNDVWNNEKTKEFKGRLLHCGRDCPIYKI
jgi:MoaA/NifB/PqqE/SkfB family radical SAM enzyme